MQRQIKDFDWDERNTAHIARNHVDDYEAEFVILFDEPFFRKTRDEKYVAFGVTQAGRYLFVVFAVKGEGLIRVITSRDMIPRERNDYKRNRR